MALTRDFRDTVRARAASDPAFREALLGEAAQGLLDGDLAGGRSALRDYINATIGFEALAEATQTPAKSLMRMFGPKGNPTSQNLVAVLAALKDKTGVRLRVTTSS
jgi:DNA-binding phage protein